MNFLPTIHGKTKVGFFFIAILLLLLTSNAVAENTVDQLFQRVQILLNMPQPRLKIHIQIYQDQEELSEVYEMITGKPTKMPAFYLKKTNTIYLQKEKLSTGILAHEMAHAIISHYPGVYPDREITESLCQYIDKEISMRGF